MEWCGGTDTSAARPGVPEYARLPAEPQKRAFVTAYLRARHGAAEPPAVEALLRDVAVFESVNNIYWGLWALSQARIEGTAEFPYLVVGRRWLRTPPKSTYTPSARQLARR